MGGGPGGQGYREEEGVDPHSTTETYVAMRLKVDNWRWAGVPVYVRTGKYLPKRVTEVAIEFNRVPHLPFAADQAEGLDPDALVLRVQPDEGITLRFGAKVPGQAFRVRSVSMDFFYGAAFLEETPEAYERLLLDALVGDQTLFIRSDEVAQAWRIVDPVLQAFEEGDVPLARYEAGTWGPDEADELLRRDGGAGAGRDRPDRRRARARVIRPTVDHHRVVGGGRCLHRPGRAGLVGPAPPRAAGGGAGQVLTLVAVTDSPAEADLVRATVHDLGVRHPSRTLVVVLEKGDERAEVGRHGRRRRRSGCTPSSRTGGRSASRRSASRCGAGPLPPRLHRGALRPARRPPGGVAALQPAVPGDPLLDVADRLVVDSRAADEGGSDVLARAAVLARRLPVTDLSWIRMAPWRSLLAGLFEGPVNRPFLDGIDRVEVAGNRGPRQLLGGWLLRRLALTPARVELKPGRPRVGAHRRHRRQRAPGRRSA